MNLWYYLPALDDILHHLVTSPDFRPENSRVAGGLWTVENWTWFLRTLPAMVAPGICALLLPFSAIGWWRGFPGRRVAVLLFLFVPIVGFSLIIGVRNPEYIAPSVILSLLFAMHGISRVRRVGFRMAIVTVILFLGLSQFWVGVFGFQPIPRLAPQSFSNRLVRAMLSNPTNYIAPLKPAFRDVGDYKLLHRLLSTMFQEDEKATVCILNTSEKMNIDMCYAILSPIFEKKPTCVNVAKLSEPSCIGAFPCDALLVFDDDVGEGKTEALDDMIEADFRKAISLTIFHRIYVHVYLPGDNPHGDT